MLHVRRGRDKPTLGLLGHILLATMMPLSRMLPCHRAARAAVCRSAAGPGRRHASCAGRAAKLKCPVEPRRDGPPQPAPYLQHPQPKMKTNGCLMDSTADSERSIPVCCPLPSTRFQSLQGCPPAQICPESNVLKLTTRTNISVFVRPPTDILSGTGSGCGSRNHTHRKP